MTVELEDKQRDNLLKKAARRLAKNVRIPGFRPGKAPYKVIVSHIGEEALQEEALRDLRDKVFQEALVEAELTPYATASLDAVEWKPLSMKVKVPVPPEVELGDYRNIRLDYESVIVTDDEIMQELERLQDEMATYTPVERPAEMGDVLSITLAAKDAKTQAAIQQQQQQQITLIDTEDDETQPDFATNLVGLSVGNEQEFTQSFPANSLNPQYANKTVEFTVQINSVQIKEIDELDDEFVGLVGDFDTLDDLKQKIREDLVEQKQASADTELTKEMLDSVVEGSQVKWPQALEELQIDQRIEQLKQQLSAQGMDLNDYLRSSQKTETELKEEQRQPIIDEIKTSLVLGKLIELENIQVDPDEVKQRVELLANINQGSPQLIEQLTSPEGLKMLADNLAIEKAQQHLLKIGKGLSDDENEVETDSNETTNNDQTEVKSEATDNSA